MDSKTNKQLTADERQELFHDTFDVTIDASVTLARLVRGAGDYLARIIGKDRVDAGMSVMLEPLASNNPKDWRHELEENEGQCFSIWPLGSLLHDLAAYAYFGIALKTPELTDPQIEVEDHLRQMVQDAANFLDESPLDLWSSDRSAPQMEQIIMLARNRWALDNDNPVEPAALAVFGGVTEARIRNMMSGADSRFANRDGKIRASDAFKWLSDRDSFFDSIWRASSPSRETLSNDSLGQPVFVPVARDSSVFHPGLAGRSGFTVGPKGEEQHILDFHNALTELQRMPIPYWRRPNEKGVPGIVRGIRWDRYELAELAAHGQNHDAL
jgi:hypothetical protein